MAKRRAVNGMGMRPRKSVSEHWEGRIKIGFDTGTGNSINKSSCEATADERTTIGGLRS